MSNQSIDEILKANPNAPTNDQFAIEFAQKILVPADQRIEGELEFSLSEGPVILSADEAEPIEWCGEYTLGMLDAVLASTLISATAKSRIEDMVDESTPTLEKTKTIGHFRFRWTETSADSRDNVTEADIDATGAALNDCWDRYTAEFRQPKADLVGGQRIIDVDVYYNSWAHGSTSSHSNRIFLNSMTTVSDACRRQTVSAHELFHRVEYAYGYVTGTSGQKWWVEALGSWSQEYSYDDINDYVTRMNSGFGNPDKGLLDRSYDACHFWKYFGEQIAKRSSAVSSEEQAVEEFMDEYSTNGLDAKAACGTVTSNRISRSFEYFFQDFSKANYIKDLDNPFTRYEYDEDEEVTTSCGRTYGPFQHVTPIVDETITSDTFSWTSPTFGVNTYGTDYLLFHLDPAVTKVSIRFEGNPAATSGQFCLHLILIKDNRWRVIYNNYASITERTWNLNLTAGQYDRCVLVVNGLDPGGQYEVSVNACMSGVWRDSFNYVWTLVQSGSNITGSVKTSTCGDYSVTGSFTGTSLVLNATGSCCDFEYKGEIDDCESGSGTWTNDCGGSGPWSMSKTDADEALAMLETEEIELADEPTTMRS